MNKKRLLLLLIFVLLAVVLIDIKIYGGKTTVSSSIKTEKTKKNKKESEKNKENMNKIKVIIKELPKNKSAEISDKFKKKNKKPRNLFKPSRNYPLFDDSQ